MLGFFTADGSMIKNKRRAPFIEFNSTDRELIEKTKIALGSNYKISPCRKNTKWKQAYRLQIGSREMFNDLFMMGLIQNKSKRACGVVG